LRRTHLLAHFLPPALAAIVGLALALQVEPFTANAVAAHLLGAGLYYAAPHIFWAGVVSLARPSGLVRHVGFLICTFALLAIGALSYVAHDPSGLPYQWLLYWPLSGALLALLVVAWFIGGRPRADAPLQGLPRASMPTFD
jgi:peptidoglycan/LPS O-acetylase OafA/YrhL